MTWITRFQQYMKDVKVETRKVTFPSRQDTAVTTWVVIILVIIMGVYLGLTDLILSNGLGLVL